MIGFRINGEFLDMMPGTSIEMEEESPYLQFNDELKGSHSFPFEIPATGKNLRILDFVTRLHTKKVRKFDAICYENDLEHSVGTIVVETTRSNINQYKSDRISAYFLVASSHFFQQVKGKKLRDYDWGGERYFKHGSYLLSQSPFWKHLVDAAMGTVDSYDYTFFPVRNDQWGTGDGRYYTRGVNAWYQENGEYKFSPFPMYVGGDGWLMGVNPICPFPYLTYIIKNLFSQIQWKISGTPLDDANLKKITLISFKDIPHGYGQLFSGVVALPDAKFDLKDYLPDMTVSEFIIAIKNRLGLTFDFDKHQRVCTVQWLNQVIDNSNVDITRYANPNYSTVFEDGKVYGIAQTVSGGEAYRTDPETFKGELWSINALPVPALANEGWVYFIRNLNSYYSCIRDMDEEVFKWESVSDNTADYGTGTNDSISTATATVAMVQEKLKGAYNAWEIEGVFPKVDFSGHWKYFNDQQLSWGLYLAIYHGLQPSLPPTRLYPFAANHNLNPLGTKISDWALTFTFPDQGDDFGIFSKFYARFFDTIDEGEIITVAAVMPKYFFDSLRFAQSIVLDNCKFFLRKKKSVIPYTGSVTLELVRG